MKRMIDLTLGGVAAVLGAPIMGLMAGVILVAVGRPVVYRQLRIGRGGRPFWILKFRTMTDEMDTKGQLLPDNCRLTGVGRWMRSWSLDELPSLWNVLTGEMSLVGPRPLVPEYLPLYSSRQARRHEVRPGLTGWAQVHGRNALDWGARLELDVWYVEHQNLALDLKILGLTVLKVLRREGISSPGHATMEPFRGER